MSDLRKKISKSFALQEHARVRIPGMSQLLSKRPDRFSYGVWPGYFSKASGVEIWDLDDNRYIDMSIGGIGATVLGYQDPDVDRAVLQAISRGISSSLNCPEEVELADRLCDIHPWAEKVRFTRSGGEAMAVAVRIARAHTDREVVAFCGYHGWHDWYLAANLDENDALEGHLQSGLDPRGVPAGITGTAFPFRYNHLEGLREIIRRQQGKVAAIVMEPIRNLEPEANFLQGVADLARETGAVLIVDEISAGFRLHSGGAHLLYDLVPDVAVFSKALGNGYPIAAIIGAGNVMDAAQKTFISSTNWTEKIGPVAALAMIDKHQKLDVGNHLIAIGRSVQDGWRALGKHYSIPLDIHGIPPLSHFAFQVEEPLVLRALMVQEMLRRGFLASTSFYSMFAHTEEHVSKYLQALDSVFQILQEAIDKGDAAGRLEGEPAVAGFARLT